VVSLKSKKRNLWYPPNKVDLRASLDILEKRRVSCPCQELKPTTCNPLQTHPSLLLGVRLHKSQEKQKSVNNLMPPPPPPPTKHLSIFCVFIFFAETL